MIQNLGVFVPIWLVLRRREATNLGVFDLCHFALVSPYSNGAVQIRVALELAEMKLGSQGTCSTWDQKKARTVSAS